MPSLFVEKSFIYAIHGRILRVRRSRWLSDKESACSAGNSETPVRLLGWEDPLEKEVVLLPEKSHGQRSLVGYSPWGCKRVGHDLATKQQQQLKPRNKLSHLWKTGFSTRINWLSRYFNGEENRLFNKWCQGN